MDTLNQYGYSFQVKVLSLIITDKTFTSNVFDILLPEYFEAKPLKWLFESTLSYFNEYRLLPTLEVFKVQITNISNPVLKTEVIAALKEVFKNIGSNDLEFVKKTTLDFCINKEFEKCFVKGIDLLREGKRDEILTMFNLASKKGMMDHLGHDYMKDIDLRYDEEIIISNRIPTGWPVIDDITDGGIPAGKLVTWIGGPGSTKTWHLIHVGAHALKLGKRVLHYTLELDETYVAKRYDSTVTHIGLDNLKYQISDIKRHLKRYNGNLLIKHFPTKSISIHGLRAHIEKTILMGDRPDLIILDYADLLKLGTNSNMRKDELLQELYEQLVGLAGELKIPIHTASQVNRTGASSDVIGGENVSESYGKMFTVDLAISISRKAKDKINNTGRIHIIKNRMGPDGMTFPEKVDTSKGLIEIYNENSESGKKTKDAMGTDEDYDRKFANKRFTELMKDNKESTDIF